MVLYLVSLLLYVSLLKPTVAMPGPMPGPKSDTEGYPYPEERGNDGTRLYFGPDDTVIPNYSSLRFNDFSDDEKMGDHNTVLEGIWCQNSDNNDNGTWYKPDDIPVPLYNGGFGDSIDSHMHHHDHDANSEKVKNHGKNQYNGTEPVFSAQFNGQSVLLRDRDSTNSLSAMDEGLYYCSIANQTLVVALYTSTTYNNNTGPSVTEMKIDIVNSDSNETFIITFNVTNGPPTHIVCVGPGDFTVNETSNLVNRTIIDKETTGVSIGLVERQDGMIQCNVSNARVIQETINGIMAIAATTSLTIKTEELPNITSIQLPNYLLSWLGSSPIYDVFYSIVEHNITQFIGYTMNNSYTVNISDLNIAYNNVTTIAFFVIGKGIPGDVSVIPSAPSNTLSVRLNFPNLNVSSDANVINIDWDQLDVVSSNGFTIDSNCKKLCEKDDQFVAQRNHTDVNTFELASLFPGSVCHISLHGIYADEKVNFINSLIQRTKSSVPELPPQNMSIVTATSQSIEIVWEKVPCSGQNGPITGYDVSYRIAVVLSNTKKTSFTVMNMSAILSDLLPYTVYFITVTPINEAGSGINSSTLMGHTEESEPGQVSSMATIDGSSTNSIIITWNEPLTVTGVITMYDIRYKQFNVTSDYEYFNGITRTIYEINLLSHYTTYTVGVRAYTSVGPGEWNEIQVVLLPPEIDNVTLAAIDNVSLVTWSLSNDDNLLKIVIEISDNSGGGIMHEIRLPNNTSSFRLTFLPNSLSYDITVFGIYLIDGELLEGKRVSLHYISPNVTYNCENIISAGGLQPKTNNTLSNMLIAVVSTVSIALLIAVIVNIILGVILWKKNEKDKDKVKETIVFLESARKMSIKEDTYVDMSKSSSPAYQNLPPVSPGCEENQAEKFPEASGIYESIL